jgi:exonuclease III
MLNCNSVKSTVKVSQLQATINSTNPDILFLVETKLDSSIPTYSFLPINYEAIRKDRNAHGRGVLIALRNATDPQMIIQHHGKPYMNPWPSSTVLASFHRQS